ncbi:hypothetical protein [Krasilnikovia sp. MM14-A1259]|uniref:hypothetical protein n=1 Tax=Krasilnikovia sp. MM14-A1259 TaxID=3373539 RepID=UPI0037F5DBC0
MSRQFRHLVAAMVLGGLLVSAPLLTRETASAGQATGARPKAAGGHAVELGCKSTPDLEVLTIRAQRVRVKRLLRTERVRVAAAARAAQAGRVPRRASDAVARHGGTEAVFRRPTTSLADDPVCALTDESTPVVVPTTLPSAPPSSVPTTPVPVPPSSVPVTDTPPSQGPPSSSTGGDSPVPPPPTQTTRPQTVPPGVSRPGVPPPVQTRTVPVVPVNQPAGGGVTQADVSPTRSRGSVAAASVIAGLPPAGGIKSLATGVQSVEVPVTSDAAPVTTSAGSAAVVSGEVAAALPPVPEDAPGGLLTLTALVCVLGVSIGAIRAIVAQRASRATMA